MSGESDECCTVHRVTVRKARKQHACSACKAAILPGHYYADVFILVGDGAEKYKRCGSCEQTWRHLDAKCCEHNRRTGSSLFAYEDLSCGLSYEDEWGDLPDEIAALPLLSSDERGALLAPKVSP